MSNTEYEFEVDEDTSPEADYSTEDVGGSSAEQAPAPAEAQASATPTPSKKHPLPNGWVTPSGLVHVLKDQGVGEFKPQQLYGYAKNGKDFPTKFNTDGRFIVPVPGTVENCDTVDGLEPEAGDPEKDAVAWVKRQLEKRAEREAKKLQAAQAAAAAAQQPQPQG